MGMFDYLKCDWPLEDPAHNALQFQTKDTNAQWMEQYTITSDGRLIHHEVTYRSVPEEERVARLMEQFPEHGPEYFKEGMWSICGSMSSLPVGDREIPFHGDLCFYSSLENGEEKYRNLKEAILEGKPPLRNPSYQSEWVEYTARFTEGRVARIWRNKNA
jgi:hypothetical protein